VAVFSECAEQSVFVLFRIALIIMCYQINYGDYKPDGTDSDDERSEEDTGKGWLLHCSFGAFGILPLWLVQRNIKKFEEVGFNSQAQYDRRAV
jgi:hypothetical protein